MKLQKITYLKWKKHENDVFEIRYRSSCSMYAKWIEKSHTLLKNENILCVFSLYSIAIPYCFYERRKNELVFFAFNLYIESTAETDFLGVKLLNNSIYTQNVI